MLKRRHFLKLLATTLGAGLAGSVSPALQAVVVRPRLSGKHSYAKFAVLLGDTFTLSDKEKHINNLIKLQLMEVTTVALNPENDQFYLVFEVLGSDFKPNGTYLIRHARAGATQLFLQPITSDLSGNFCRADFNLLI